MSPPYLIRFPRLGAPDIGYITVAEGTNLVPFAVARTFWTYHTPESIVRGRHAHHQTQQVLVAVTGRITVTAEVLGAPVQAFVLDQPTVGLYIPPHAWHTMQYSAGAVQLVLASEAYDPADYIRDYEEFRRIWG